MGLSDYFAKWITPATAWKRANRAEELREGREYVRWQGGRRDAGPSCARSIGESLKAAPVAAAAAKAGKVELEKGGDHQPGAGRQPAG